MAAYLWFLTDEKTGLAASQVSIAPWRRHSTVNNKAMESTKNCQQQQKPRFSMQNLNLQFRGPMKHIKSDAKFCMYMGFPRPH